MVTSARPIAYSDTGTELSNAASDEFAISGDRPPTNTDASSCPTARPECRTSVLNSSVKNAGCEPIIAAWHTPLPRKNARKINPGVWLSMSQKKGKAISARPVALNR